MKYETKRIVEELDLIDFTPEEMYKLNEFYKQVIGNRYPSLAKSGQIYPVRRMVLSDDLSRIEVVVSTNGKIVPPPPDLERPAMSSPLSTSS